MVSLGNLLTAVIAAKSLSTAQFGNYSLLFATWLIIAGLGNAVVAEPVRVFGVNLSSTAKNQYASSQIILRLTTSVLVIIAAFVAARLLDGGQISISASFSLLCVATLFQELSRAFNAADRIWIEVLLSDAICYSSRLAGLFFLSYFECVTIDRVLLVMALGSAVGTLRCPLGQAAFSRPTFQQLVRHWRQNWLYGKWLVLESVVSSASTQVYLFIVGAQGGLAAAAGLAAAQSVVNLLNLLLVSSTINVASNSRLALLSQGYAEWRRYIIRSGAFVIGVAVLAVALLIPFAHRAMAFLYTPAVATYDYLIPTLAIGMVLMMCNAMLSVAFRTAEMPKVGVGAKSLSAVVANLSAFPLIDRFGTLGAALGNILTQLCWLGVYGYNILVKRALSEKNIRLVVAVGPPS